MLTIEKALSFYTDQITMEYDTNTKKIIKQLHPDDIDEFLESAEAVRLLCAFQRRKEFNKFFTKLDAYKNEIYNLPTAADFRGKNGDKVKEQVDNIFKEEFGDE